MHSPTSDARTRAWITYKPRTAVMDASYDQQERAYLISSTDNSEEESSHNQHLPDTASAYPTILVEYSSSRFSW
jgi:hypothetical protein